MAIAGKSSTHLEKSPSRCDTHCASCRKEVTRHMNREYHKWSSPSLQRDMELLVFGSAGARVLVFPTSMGRFFQWEDFGMIGALSSQLEQGQIQLFCVDSVDGESFYAKERPPTERIQRHVQYDRYLHDEVLPFTKSKNENPFLMTAGASFGAYHAVNFALRHPEVVDRTIGLSGLYDISGFMSGYSDQDVYYNDPVDFIAYESDPTRLRVLRHIDIILAIGRDDPSCPNNESFSQMLWGKDIWHALRIWDGWAHDWPWWREMIQRYIGGHD